jgi:hypothetical protein
MLFVSGQLLFGRVARSGMFCVLEFFAMFWAAGSDCFNMGQFGILGCSGQFGFVVSILSGASRVVWE